MTTADALQNLVRGAVGTASIADALPRYVSGAPKWLDPETDVWNVAPLHPRTDVKTWSLDFRRVTHPELRALSRAHALWQIVEQRVSPSTLTGALNVFIYLGNQLGARPLKSLKTEDFYAAELDIRSHYSARTSARMYAGLQRVSAWLNRQTELRLDYTSTLRLPIAHGRMAADNKRDAKLLPDAVVADLLSARNRSNLSDRDRFYLNAISISVATGFRLGELLTLPADCLIQEQGALLVRSFVSKNGKASPRPVPAEMADIVIGAVGFIRAITQPAREQAQAWTNEAPIDWVSVVRDHDPTAFKYFVGRWLSDWITDPDHRMIDPHCAYFSQGDRSRWVFLTELLDTHKGNISTISRKLGMARVSVTKLIRQLEASKRNEVYLGSKNSSSRRAFDTDRRFPSVAAFGRLTGLNLHKSPRNALLMELVDKARNAQLSQSEFHRPHRNASLEEQYRITPEVLRHPETGEAVLRMDEALFVLFKNQLSSGHAIVRGRIKAVSPDQFNHWLSGYTRDRGTGGLGDAVCARLGILDPRTEKPAKLTNHDFRHWLATAYENGGLSQTQIATLFNRSSSSSNSVYDHTSCSVRRERLKDAIADGLLIGHAPTAYAQIAKESAEEAIEYLENAIKFHNPMPHGICRLNWALEPCPHALSCFSCGDLRDDESEPCEHLIIDANDADHLDEIARIHRNALSICEVFEDDGAEKSPQYSQFQRIARSTLTILKKAGRS